MEHGVIGLISGLGNPGREYCNTRHNAGFMVIDALLGSLNGKAQQFHGFESFYWQLRFRGRSLVLQKPQTFMNASGSAVKPLLRAKNLEAQSLMVVYDDTALELGSIRIRKNGGAGGHNGVQSLIDELGTEEFARLRIGIGASEGKVKRDYVLGEFDEGEKELFGEVVLRSVEALKDVLSCGIDRAMNKYNKKEAKETKTNNNGTEVKN